MIWTHLDGILLHYIMASNGDRGHREGPEATERFEGATRRLFAVSSEEFTKYDAAYQKSRRAKRSRHIHRVAKAR